jgi:hypothetical protein
MNIETNDLFNKDCGFDITASDSLSFDQTIQPLDNDNSSLNISKYTENDTTTAFDELKEFLVLPAQMECFITDESKNLNVDKSYNDSFGIDTFDKYTKELDDSIMAYIMTNYNAAFKSSYVTRLDNIKEVLDSLSAQESDNTNIFDPEVDKVLEDLFNSFFGKHYCGLTLDFHAYDLFSKDYDIMIKKMQDDKLLKGLQKKITKTPDLHFKEFLKIYKYVKIFPELLTLGYLLNSTQYKRLPIQLHLISLFLTKNENDLISKRNFVLFLISKTYKYSHRAHFDWLSLIQYQELIADDSSKLFFFCWEFSCYTRTIIIRRINYHEDPYFYFAENDRIHYDVVLRLFLFQHLLYLKYKNVNDFEMEEFKLFAISIFEEKNGCCNSQFNRFMNMVQV